jgi:hypothetical protein
MSDNAPCSNREHDTSNELRAVRADRLLLTACEACVEGFAQAPPYCASPRVRAATAARTRFFSLEPYFLGASMSSDR